VNYVSPNDVAEIAVSAILTPKEHHRVGYTITGPAALKDEQVALLLGKLLHKKVTYVDQPLKVFVASHGCATDWGPGSDVAYFERVKATGAEEDSRSFVSSDFSRICGMPSETYEEYLNARDKMTPRELTSLP